MNKIIYNVLNKIEHKNYEAYLIGGYVRDSILGINSYDIDICTNMPINLVATLFPKSTLTNYGNASFKIKKYNFEITTYRRELEYFKRKPIKIEYIDSLEEDLQRRDFTINTICMDKNEHIIDYLNAIHDLNNKTIKVVGDISIKINEDPLRILRAIRLATILDFNLDKKLASYIKENNYLILQLSKERIKNELTKIMFSKNVLKGLNLLDNLGVSNLLGITYDSNLDIKLIPYFIDFKYEFYSKREYQELLKIRKLLNEGLNSFNIYYEGLDVALKVADILNINSNIIKIKYKCLPIHKTSDIKITSDEIIERLKISPRKLKDVYKYLEILIISGKIKNTIKDIRKHLGDYNG